MATTQGPYHLGGWSLEALIAYEMARQLREQGEEVATVALLDKGVDAGEGMGEGIDQSAGFMELQDLLPNQQNISVSQFQSLSREEQLDFFVRRIEEAGLVAAGVTPEVAERMLNVLEANSQAALTWDSHGELRTAALRSSCRLVPSRGNAARLRRRLAGCRDGYGTRLPRRASFDDA